MIILGIDPGKATGWALIKIENNFITPINFGVSRDQTANDLLPYIRKADIVVVESFHVRPSYAKRGAFDYDDMVAPRVIGAVTALCEVIGRPVKMQPASTKPMGYAWSGRKYVKNKKGMHQWDALAHAVYYAVKVERAYPTSKKKPGKSDAPNQ